LKCQFYLNPSQCGCFLSSNRTDNAPEAAEELGMAFGSILKTTNKFEKKNLLCHSMGNYVLRKAAGKVQGVQFDNIIMVAAVSEFYFYTEVALDNA